VCCVRSRVVALDRFVSNFTNRLDSKGRISIPASFRTVLAKDGFEGLYVHRALDAQALDCGGHALMREIDGVLGRFATYTDDHDVYSTALLGTSEILKVDPEGRIALSEPAKAWLGIGAEATFVGQGYKFQIWEPKRFDAYLDEARNRVREHRKQIGASHAGAATPRPRGAGE
jgi:MraZ protein